MPFSPCNHPFTDALLAALGLSGRKITKLTLSLAIDDLVTVELTELATCHDTGKLVEQAGKYQLEPFGDEWREAASLAAATVNSME